MRVSMVGGSVYLLTKHDPLNDTNSLPACEERMEGEHVNVKLKCAYALAVACVLGVMACATGGDAPPKFGSERTVEAGVAGELATRASRPSGTEKPSEDKASEVQRASTDASPSPLAQTSANPAESANALDFQSLISAFAHNDEIEALLAMYRYEEALKELDVAAEYSNGDFDSSRALYLRGVVNSRLGYYEEAEPILLSLIEDGNFVASALAELGHIYFLTGDFVGAAAYLERAVSYQPSFGREYLARYYRALVRLSESDIEGAHSDLVYAVNNSPRDWELWGEARLFLVQAHNTDPTLETPRTIEFAKSQGYDPDRLSLLRTIVLSR